MIMDYGRFLSTWDEYSHWGKMVKEMLRIDRFYSEPQSNLLVHKDYPPFAVVFEMFWCRLSLGYTEGAVTTALHVFGFSMILPPVFEQFKCRERDGKLQRFFGQLVLVVICLLLIFNFDYIQAMTINVDLFLALFYASMILMISDREFCRSGLGFATLLIGQFGIILTKQMGIAFALLVWFFYTMSEVLQVKERGSDTAQGRLILGSESLLMLVVPIISYLIWNNYISGLGLTGAIRS